MLSDILGQDRKLLTKHDCNFADAKMPSEIELNCLTFTKGCLKILPCWFC